MTTAEKSPDLRVRRTRQLIHQAFMELMAEKNFQAITVQDITSRAMVNRSTFYDHYVDKYALLEQSVSDMFREALAAKLPDANRYSTENLRALIGIMCDFFAALHGHCRAADEQNIALFESQVMKLVKDVLTGWLAAESPTEAGRTELAVALGSWAIYGAAQFWREGKYGGSLDAYTAEVAPIIEETVKGLNR